MRSLVKELHAADMLHDHRGYSVEPWVISLGVLMRRIIAFILACSDVDEVCSSDVDEAMFFGCMNYRL